MIFFKRRLVFWLLRAYVKRWGKRILFFFILGLLTFFVLFKTVIVLVPKIPVGKKESIGLSESYRFENLPSSIMSQVSSGLTTLSENGEVKPDLATSWEIKNNGKTYIFHLKKKAYFSDSTRLSSRLVNYSFSDVSVSRPDEYSVVFTLKDNFSPFLVAVSRPIFKENFIGTGEFKIKDIKLNGGFVESLTLASLENQYYTKTYHFYPSQYALKIAFALGEVEKAVGLTDISFKNTTFSAFPFVRVTKVVDYNRLVTLFYNTKDSYLSNEKVRNGLSYALPDSFEFGQRVYAPYAPGFWAYSQRFQERQQDIAHAKKLLSESDDEGSLDSAVSIKTLAKYRKTAEAIGSEWKKIGVKTKIEVVETVPSAFQIFLGDFQVPKDPDQYTLWHKDQQNNITRYENLRIDRILEDGRKTTDITQRKKIYADFQKYLLADSPAAFLYFPYIYEINR